MRFRLIEDNDEFPNDGETCWYWDTGRPYGEDGFIAVQTYCDRDPNQFVRHEEMVLLFTDQAEYYAVCLSCKSVYGRLQWSGSTRNPGWETKSQLYLENHISKKGWCEFCDPVFGSGGWRLD
jgi:hypothetical protein